jgi:hypothetical protein
LEWRSFWSGRDVLHNSRRRRITRNHHIRIREQDHWQRDLGLKIAWALAAKLIGLTLLWYLFFRGGGS